MSFVALVVFSTTLIESSLESQRLDAKVIAVNILALHHELGDALAFVVGFRVYFHPAVLTHVVIGIALRARSSGVVLLSFRAPRSTVPSHWGSPEQELAFREVARVAISE